MSEDESNLVKHAKRELSLLEKTSKEPMDDLERELHDSIIEIVKTFSKVEHSGSSATWTIGVINKLLKFQNLTPLTKNRDEWNNVSEVMGRPCWQNNRNSAIFSEDCGETMYDVNKK